MTAKLLYVLLHTELLPCFNLFRCFRFIQLFVREIFLQSQLRKTIAIRSLKIKKKLHEYFFNVDNYHIAVFLHLNSLIYSLIIRFCKMYKYSCEGNHEKADGAASTTPSHELEGGG